MQDWTRDQMWEEGHEKDVVQQARVLCLTLLHVEQIADLREGEERDSQWKLDRGYAP